MRVIDGALRLLSAISIGFMAAFIFTDVIGRYVFNSPINGDQEIVAYLLGYTVFAAFPLITRDQDHIKFGLFDGLYRGRVGTVQRALMLAFTLALTGYIAFLLFQQAASLSESGTLTQFLDAPVGPLIYGLAIFAALAVLLLAAAVPRILKSGAGPGGDNAP